MSGGSEREKGEKRGKGRILKKKPGSVFGVTAEGWQREGKWEKRGKSFKKKPPRPSELGFGGSPGFWGVPDLSPVLCFPILPPGAGRIPNSPRPRSSRASGVTGKAARWGRCFGGKKGLLGMLFFGKKELWGHLFLGKKAMWGRFFRGQTGSGDVRRLFRGKTRYGDDFLGEKSESGVVGTLS